MKLNIRGDKIEVTESIKAYVEEKLSKLDKYFKEDVEAKVLIRVRNNLQFIEVTIPTNKFTIRAEAGNPDLYAAIDKAEEILEQCDDVFYENEEQINFILQEYANKLEN